MGTIYANVTAGEARKITENSSFLINTIYKNIRESAEHGRSVYQFDYGFEDHDVILWIVKNLQDKGYKVKVQESLDEETEILFGTLFISW